MIDILIPMAVLNETCDPSVRFGRLLLSPHEPVGRAMKDPLARSRISRPAARNLGLRFDEISPHNRNISRNYSNDSYVSYKVPLEFGRVLAIISSVGDPSQKSRRAKTCLFNNLTLHDLPSSYPLLSKPSASISNFVKCLEGSILKLLYHFISTS